MRHSVGIFISIIFLHIAVDLNGQKLPSNDRAEILKIYYSFDSSALKEVNMNFEQYFELNKNYYNALQSEKTKIINLRSPNDLCANGDFESGDVENSEWLFNWCSGQINPICGSNRINIGQFGPSSSTSPPPPLNQQVRHQVVSSTSVDNLGPLQINTVPPNPPGNSYSLRLGNAYNNYGLESVSKQITVSSTNSTLRFSYSIVMNNPANHSLTQQPYFGVFINEVGTNIDYSNLVDLGNGSNIISSSNPLLTILNDANGVNVPVYGSPVVFKDWTCVTVDLSQIIGKTVNIKFENRDCWQGLHFGYTYLDNICLGCGLDDPEGSIALIDSAACGIPGKICIDYTVPQGNNPQLQIDLEIIQNGTVSSTLNSPVFTSDGSFCFGIVSPISQSFDYRVVGHPSAGGFNYSPKIIGNSIEGVLPGVSNDYLIPCNSVPELPSCCRTDLSIYIDPPSTIPAADGVMNGIPISVGTEVVGIHQDATLPITELRISIVDIQYNYNHQSCDQCINNPALWGSLSTTDQTIGNPGNLLTLESMPFQTNIPGMLSTYGNGRELIWSNPNGAMLKDGDSFKISYLLPPSLDLPCCLTTARICTRISWKDANCNVCETYNCTNVQIGTPQN